MIDTNNSLQGALPEEQAKYLVHTRHEITQILRDLIRKNQIVTGYFNQGQAFFLTAILEVDPDTGQLVLDCGPDPVINRRALDSNRFVFVTNQNRVKIQFNTAALEQIEYKGYPAFRTQLPSSLLKLQRRKFYRLVTPINTPLYCIVPDSESGRVETNVANISVGGVAISDFPDATILEKGLLFPNCSIAIPEEGTVTTTLEIRNIQQTTQRSGQTVMHVGCIFVDLPAPHQAMIQRYITRIDLERRSRVK